MGGRQYTIDRIVDMAQTDKGTQYRVQWKGHDTHTWEPGWELEGNAMIVGIAIDAVQRFQLDR